MTIVNSIQDIPPLSGPIALTIGNFDGMHLGHQLLIKKAHALTGSKGKVVALTFSNHPWTFFHPDSPIPLISPLKQKLQLLKDAGVDVVIALPFSKEIASMSYSDFLEMIWDKTAFNFLILGDGARMGKNLEGDATRIRALGETFPFSAHYHSKMEHDGDTISSGKVRAMIETARFEDASHYLGRPYSLSLQFQGKEAPLNDLCKPPPGTYQVLCKTPNYSKRCEVFINETLTLPFTPTTPILEIVF